MNLFLSRSVEITLHVKTKHRGSVNFIIKLRKYVAKAYTLLENVYGNVCVFGKQVFEWMKIFKEQNTGNDPAVVTHRKKVGGLVRKDQQLIN